MNFFHNWLAACLAMLAVCAPVKAAVNDIFPADYVAAPPGTTSVALYAFDRRMHGPYRAGRQSFPGELDNQTLALRISHVTELAGSKISPVLVLSGTHLSLAPQTLKNALATEPDGYGDVRLGLTAWLIDRPQDRHWLGVTGTLIAPTGSYHAAQTLNIGENRWRFILGGGWIRPIITPELLLELSPEIAWYGDNDRYKTHKTRAQAVSLALTGYLRYRLTPLLHGHLGWQENHGGATRIDGTEQHDSMNNQRVLAGVTALLPEKNQLILRYAHDTHIDNGFKLNRELVLRWMKSY